MDEGTSSNSQAVKRTGNHGRKDSHGDYLENGATTEIVRRKMHLHGLSDCVQSNTVHCRFEQYIDVGLVVLGSNNVLALDACNNVNELIRTWGENDWHLPGKFLRLNKMKCEDLHFYLERTKIIYHSNTCDFASREFLTAVKRAKNLVEESSHNEWLLKAVELWECSEHFLEVFLDLCRSAHTMISGVKNTEEQEWLMKENDWMMKEQERLLNSRRPVAQGKFLKIQSYDDKKTLDAMVKATIQNKILREGGPEHQLALLLEDRLNDQSMRHPPILTSFIFCIRSRFSLLTKGSSKNGANGIVLRFPWVYEKQFAVKMRYPNTNTVESMFKHEFDILDKYRSPYIVAVVGYWELESWLDMRPWTTLCPFLLMESLECDSEGLICSYRESRRGMQEGFSALETIKLMLPISKALLFLHDKDVAHRDIKPQNIMCNDALLNLDDAIVKLIDFGEATEDVSKIPLHKHRRVGTYGFMDPEMGQMEKLDPETGKRKGYDLLRADVFSFAMVFLNLLTWSSPWGMTGRGLQDKLDNGERPPLPSDLPDYVSFIVKCCWCAYPPARPTFRDICSMLQNAKMLLVDGNFLGKRDDLFCYEDGECIERKIVDRRFLDELRPL